MVDDFGQVVEQCSLRIAQKAVRTAKGVLLADTRNRERLARETGQQHVMGWNFLRRICIGPHILGKNMFAVGRFGEIGAVGLPAEPVPFRREYTPPTNTFKRNTNAADTGKEVDKAKTLGPCAGAAHVCGLPQFLQSELVDPLALALHVAPDCPVTDAKQLCCRVDVETGALHQFCKFCSWMRVHVPAPDLCLLLTTCHNLSQHIWEPCF